MNQRNIFFIALSVIMSGVTYLACTGTDISTGGDPDLSITYPEADLSGEVLTTADLTGYIPDGGTVVMTGDGGTRLCFKALCAGKQYACGDCLDNDGDGKVDADDPNCLGPCHNSESSLSLNIPGANNAPCKADCYFDQDTGAGNDDCQWDHRCDVNSVAPNYYPEGSQCKYDATYKITSTLTCSGAVAGQSKTCHDICDKLTPNACDCFGCCAIGPQADVAQNRGIWLGSTDTNGNPSCTLATAGDPAKCKVCQIVTSCFKPCGRCQLCLGKTDLPADCFPTGGGTSDGGMTGTPTCPASLCPTGGQPCGLAGCNPCAAGNYCVTGCCIPVPG